MNGLPDETEVETADTVVLQNPRLGLDVSQITRPRFLRTNK